MVKLAKYSGLLETQPVIIALQQPTELPAFTAYYEKLLRRLMLEYGDILLVPAN